MRKVVGAFLLGCFWATPSWAFCFDEHEAVKPVPESQPEQKQEYQPPQQDIYTMASPRGWDRMQWASAGLGTGGLISLTAGIALLATRRRSKLRAAAAATEAEPLNPESNS